jgi:phospholipase C
MADAIEHVVVLMLENRSFDQMLGCLQPVVSGLEGIDVTEIPPVCYIDCRSNARRYFQMAAPEPPAKHFIGDMTMTCANPPELPHFLAQFHICRFWRQGDVVDKLP